MNTITNQLYVLTYDELVILNAGTHEVVRRVEHGMDLASVRGTFGAALNPVTDRLYVGIIDDEWWELERGIRSGVIRVFDVDTEQTIAEIPVDEGAGIAVNGRTTI